MMTKILINSFTIRQMNYNGLLKPFHGNIPKYYAFYFQQMLKKNYIYSKCFQWLLKACLHNLFFFCNLVGIIRELNKLV